MENVGVQQIRPGEHLWCYNIYMSKLIFCQKEDYKIIYYPQKQTCMYNGGYFNDKNG